MKSKIKLLAFILLCSSITLFPLLFDSCTTADAEIPLALDNQRFRQGSSPNKPNSITKIRDEIVILNQTFDLEKDGKPEDTPQGWNVTEELYGSLKIDDQTYYNGNASARFVDNSTYGSPLPYRDFTEQRRAIVVSFAIRPIADSGKHSNLEIYVSDGGISGVSIHFNEHGRIEYHSGMYSYGLLDYSANKWYRIKIIVDIPKSKSHIYINGRLIVEDAGASVLSVDRIGFGEALAGQPIGYIDDVLIRSISVPEDYPTIQKAIDAANPGDTIFVRSRTYYECISIKNKDGLRIVGENKSNTIVDRGFTLETLPILSIENSNNLTISGFTIRNGAGHGISVSGSDNNITDNIISSNLRCGICIRGKEDVGNTIWENVIENNDVGVNCSADGGNTFYHNKFVCNTRQAIDKGSNEWYNGYGPYTTYGGNYWGDYISLDEKWGMSRAWKGPDGFCDREYIIDDNSVDEYPLYLIENVTLYAIIKPKPLELVKCNKSYSPDYNRKALVTVNTTNGVQVNEAILYFRVKDNRTWQSRPMTISARNLSAIIPIHPYWTEDERTTVQYRVNASNVHGVWAPSTTFSYVVADTVEPRITSVKLPPEDPFDDEPVEVTARVIEPKNASGVDKVFLNYTADGVHWGVTKMDYDPNRQIANGTIPPLDCENGDVKAFIRAYDMAGNPAIVKLEYSVRCSPKLSVIDRKTETIEIYSLDFEVMSVGFPKDWTGKEAGEERKFVIKNAGKGELNWNISTVVDEDCKWLSVKPNYGTLPREHPVTEDIIEKDDVTVTVKTGCLEAGNYVGRLNVTSNGGDRIIYVYVKVRTVVIDEVGVSDNRTDIGSDQTIRFHAIWGHYPQPVQYGKIEIRREFNGEKTTDDYETDEDGWVIFTDSSSEVGQTIWTVKSVRCKYVYHNKTYWIRSYDVTAPEEDYPAKIIWDSVKVTLHITDNRTYVGDSVNITWNGVYEYDGKVFRGSVTLNNTRTLPFDGSINQTYNKVVKRCYKTKSISDPFYELKNFTTNVVCCIWDRIAIIGGGVEPAEPYVNQGSTVWFRAVYEFDGSWLTNMTVDGTMGELNISQTVDGEKEEKKMSWSGDDFRWEYKYLCKAIGTITFQVLDVSESQYEIKNWIDAVGPITLKCRARVETGWLELSFTVDGRPPTESATFKVEFPNGTAKTYLGISVKITNVPVGSYRITCTYDEQEQIREGIIVETDEGTKENFLFRQVIPNLMWTIVYTVVGGAGLSQILWLVKRIRESKKSRARI